MARHRNNPCSYLPRRMQIVLSLATFIILSIIFLGSSSEKRTSVSDNISRQFADSKLNVFRSAVHTPPPLQANSVAGDISWFSHWNWRNPFSSTVAIDDRALLPEQVPRTPVYTYYNLDTKKPKAERQAENDLLLAWRRAWWAKGFKPVILGRAEAAQNPLYKQMQALNLDSGLEVDVMRWLAWGNMGTGILSDWLAFPMCEYDNPTLDALRNGDFTQLTAFKGLESGLFAGDGNKVHEAIRTAISSHIPPDGASFLEAIPQGQLNVVSSNDAVAFYSREVVKTKYKSLYTSIQEDPAAGLNSLRQLIESHLQSTWQAQFPEGIAALRPIPESMTAATTEAYWLAKNLSTCLNTPIASACPPNIPNCNTCMTATPMPIKTPKVYVNNTRLFSIGTVPHPYTMTALIKKKLVNSFKEIRRETKRDPYILAVTAQVLGTGRSSYERIVYMKDTIATDYGRSHSLWMTAERLFDAAWREDLHWIFGFPIPTTAPDAGNSDSPVPGAELERREKEQSAQPYKPAKMPDDKGVALEAEIIEECRAVVAKHSSKANMQVRRVVEHWSLADAELWHFVRAFAAQRKMERVAWEEEERAYAGSAKKVA